MNISIIEISDALSATQSLETELKKLEADLPPIQEELHTLETTFEFTNPSQLSRLAQLQAALNASVNRLVYARTLFDNSRRELIQKFDGFLITFHARQNDLMKRTQDAVRKAIKPSKFQNVESTIDSAPIVLELQQIGPMARGGVQIDEVQRLVAAEIEKWKKADTFERENLAK